LHFLDRIGNIIHRFHVMDDKSVGQVPLVDDLDDIGVAGMQPDGAVVFSFNFHGAPHSMGRFSYLSKSESSSMVVTRQQMPGFLQLFENNL
jgi:hypothetical protein